MGMNISAIRSVPVFAFVRTTYACVILIKLYFSASHPQSELGKVIDKNSLRVDEHMDKLLDTLRKAAENESSRQAQKFTILLMMMRHWYSKQKAEIERGLNTAPEPANSFKRLGLTECNSNSNSNSNEGSRGGGGSSGGPMEGMETPISMEDVPTPEVDHFHDSMGPPPPPRSTSLSAATPLQMLSNAALESSHGAGQQYASTPSPAPSMGMATPRLAPQASYGGWTPGVFPMMQGDGLGTPVMDGGMQSGDVGGYGIGGHGVVGEGSGDVGDRVGMVGNVGGMEFVPQYIFTGNGEMFMDDTFWAMMDGSMNIFDFGGRFQ